MIALDALRHVWNVLQGTGTPVALAGGLALAAWKHVRATRDVDLLVSIPPEGERAILSALTAAGIRSKSAPPIRPLGDVRIAQFLYEPPEALVDIQIDLLIADTEFHQQALERRIPAELDGLTIEVLTCEDLILLKLLAGRILDRADVIALMHENQTQLDESYLNDWASRLNVTKELTEAREAAR